MKKIVKRVVLLLWAVTTLYTLAAGYLVHGLRVYRLGTTLGAVLATSRPYTLAAALVLWAVVLVWGKRWLSARKKAAAQAQPQAAPAAKPRWGKKAKAAAAAPIQPATGATAPMPQAAAQPPIQPATGATMPMPQAAAQPPIQPAMGATMPMPQAAAAAPIQPAKGATMPMPQAAAQDYTPIAPPTGNLCPACGQPTKPGAKFCSKCGHRLEGST